jgi:23S rRNA (pseudouridine1915-N3)-methyltransferase
VRLLIAAVGRLKAGPERQLFEHYLERLRASGRPLGLGPPELIEIIEGRAGDAPGRRRDEAARLLSAAGADALTVALDGGGRAVSSEDFARQLAAWQAQGRRSIAFLIGGPDGHGEAVLAQAAFKLSLGAMTLPHGLARIVLAEQLYRAATILSGHPYHRG